jgi:glycosyltransferase involved in cell wall biosynthesis/tetratricopeptide (TPR) repeat protein
MSRSTLLRRFAGRLASQPLPDDKRAVDAEPRDDITLAVERGLARGRAGQVVPAKILTSAQKRLQSAAATADGGAKALSELLVLIEEYPENERLQVLAARMIDADKYTRRAPLAWQALALRMPHSTEALRMHLRWTLRLVDVGAARLALRGRFPEQPSVYTDILLYARACEEVKMFDEADQAYEAAITLEQERDEPFLAYAKSLQARGFLDRATEVIERASAQVQAKDAVVHFKAHINLERHQLSAVETTTRPASHSGNVALAALLNSIAERRVVAPSGPRSFVGSILMLNGSLGSGGAERQLTNTAIGLQSCIDQGRQLYGRDIIGPVTVCVRSFTSRPGADFFRAPLTKANVATMEYAGLEIYGGNRRQSLVRGAEDTLRFLPPQMVEGTERLTDMIAGYRPEIVHIWQDGTIFATALAALLAGVPRIILSVRTVPPIDRPSRMKPQYDVLYPALIKMPGVILSANSHYAARRYADWLSVDPDSIPVVHNGLSRLPADATPDDLDQLRKFNTTTAGHDFTVGSVMRFDDNKRPYLWLDCAAALLSTTPTARFVLVGDGPLLATAKQYAEMLGIAGRVSFVGQSDSIGFWLKQFDGFLLLSRFEGLPNVLIEAQLAGVPVVSTPAGGAAETVQQGQTGLVLEDGENLDPRTVADALRMLRENKDQRGQFELDARAWVERKFSIEQMLEATVRVYTQ